MAIKTKPTTPELQITHRDDPVKALSLVEDRIKKLWKRMCDKEKVHGAAPDILTLAAFEKNIANWQGDPKALDWAVELAIQINEDTDAWKEAGERGKPPLFDLLERWHKDQPIVIDQTEKRNDSRIMPRIVQVESRPARRFGELLGGLNDGRKLSQQAVLDFKDNYNPDSMRVPLIELCDISGRRITMRGKGAPLESRLLIATLLTIPYDQRKPGGIYRIAPTMRELINALYPNGFHKTNQWPALRNAILTARDYGIHDGQGMWLPLALRYLPDNPSFDDSIVFDIALPDSLNPNGAIIDLPTLNQLGVKSGAQWRAYIGVATLTWIPGITQKKLPNAKGRYGDSQNADDYPVFTSLDRRAIAFGSDKRRNRTRAEIDVAFENLPGFRVIDKQAIESKTGRRGWRIVPEDVADKIQRKRRK